MKLRRKRKRRKAQSPLLLDKKSQIWEKEKNLRVERENINGAPEYGRRSELQTQFVEIANIRPTLSFASFLLPSQTEWSM
jgi:hypothetical protein